jgi:hypothetical protein
MLPADVQQYQSLRIQRRYRRAAREFSCLAARIFFVM